MIASDVFWLIRRLQEFRPDRPTASSNRTPINNPCHERHRFKLTTDFTGCVKTINHNYREKSFLSGSSKQFIVALTTGALWCFSSYRSSTDNSEVQTAAIPLLITEGPTRKKKKILTTFRYFQRLQ